MRAQNVAQSGTELSGAGRADGPYTYLVTLVPREVTAGDLAVVKGTLIDGGLTIGLVRDGFWAVTAEVHERGQFAVVLAAAATAKYQLVVANSLSPDQTRNRFTIDRIGWLER
jgi:hypothetical protein